MTTSMPTSEMLGSSPYSIVHTCLDDEINDRVAQARMIQALDPSLSKALGCMKQAFLSMFARRVQLIKSRSQAFEDAHVTVYDKVLLELTNNGEDLENPSAVTYFCEELLGVSVLTENLHATQPVIDAILVDSTIEKPGQHPGENHTALPSSDTTMRSEAETLGNFSDQIPDNNITKTSDGYISRLISLYHQAKADYASVAEEGSERTASAARFLRDTAENTIHTLRERDVEPKLLQDIQATYDVTKDVVVSLNGGKKRKFDRTRNDRCNNEAPRTENELVYTQREHFHPAIAPYQRYCTSRNAFMDVPSFPGHIHVITNRKHHGQHHGHPLENATPGTRPKFTLGMVNDSIKKKKKQPQKGRGHSGIPFGYTRPVDSWHPPRYRE